ncbi:FYVE-domain-containing protein [Coniochaeta sp. PMI_546]|nr:FYVE-domain-containing protein [Coniochaeta sp. PMI_546]
MSSSGNNQGSNPSDPIDLLSSSPETQRTRQAAHIASNESDDGASVIEQASRVSQPSIRPKRESASPDDDTDSDLGYRRTRTFRGGNRDRSSSSSGQGSSGPAPQIPGTASNPIIVGGTPSLPVQLQQDHEPGPSRTSQDIPAELWRRNSNYTAANPYPPIRPAAGASQSMSRPAQPSGTPARPAPTNPRMTALPAVSLPRWQPDAEVTYCPICHTQFSFFIRKHHCRKCGRVVCDACSPHRITIPYQYIVQPPGTPRISRGEYPASLIAGEGGYADFSGLGGGERVRLCNPCVPDPNITPPQAQVQDAASASGGHARSQSTINQPPASHTPLMNRLSAYMGSYNQTPEQFARGRSVTIGNQSNPASPGPNPPSYEPRRPVRPGRAPASARPYQGLAAESSPVLASGSVPGGSSSSRNNRALPAVPQPQPRRQIPEEDECPVCHRELPSRTLPDFEAQREAHITACIMSHSSTPTRGTGVPSPSSLLPRRTGMFPYKATEKDCVDSAECTICLEEFEVGVDMARLECLCRFHRRCINAWFERHPGQCPMHQHDGYGF